MHFLSTSTLALLALANTALGAGAVHSSMSKINNDMLATDRSVSSWAGNLLTVAPVLMRANSLMGSLKAGTDATKNAGNLTADEAKNVLDMVTESGNSARQLSDTLVGAKSKFSQIPLADVFVAGLMDAFAKRTQEFGAALNDKMPEAKERVSAAFESVQDSIGDAAKAYA
ncbi:hypothetical protein XA68_17121 [Ophiocordyceps unilateralis]|uniref:Cell wall galactomannoprotein n=1 Tax=Ophiocordyceps unilateralis TaxID=268505 RepID=A0A2A9P5C8_OPHUN|nr:hypothetical protein XA68_17121 [Ophiocordyceps unilateralis]